MALRHRLVSIPAAHASTSAAVGSRKNVLMYANHVSIDAFRGESRESAYPEVPIADDYGAPEKQVMQGLPYEVRMPDVHRWHCLPPAQIRTRRRRK